MINWTSKDEFEIDGINFTLDITPGPNRRQSTNSNFTLVKTRSYLSDYIDLSKESFPHILELGLFQGGSLVFFDKIFKPEKMVGLEISSKKIDALENYIKTESPHITTYYKSSQDDVRLLKSIVEKDLDGRLDLVVDDASHLYEQTKKSISTLFPLMKPGGIYVIEDWAWSHRPGSQNKKHPWYSKPALTNLVFEIITELGSGKEIESILINNNLVRIRKSKNSDSQTIFEEAALRGHSMPLI
jgi:cephalosporin hydroxylase